MDSVKQRSNPVVVTEATDFEGPLLNPWLIRIHHLNLFLPHEVLPNQLNSLSVQQTYSRRQKKVYVA